MKFKSLWLLLLAIPLLAQGQEEKKYLFDSGKVDFTTVFVSLSPGSFISEVQDEYTGVTEARIGFILNDRFSFSYFITGSPAKTKISLPEYESEEWFRWIGEGVYLDELSPTVGYVSFFYSGFGFAYFHKSQRKLFPTAGFDFGFSGQARINEGSGFFQTNIYTTRSTSITPTLGLGLNLTSWWRVHANAGYRYVEIADKGIFQNENFNSPTFNLSLVFGKF